MNKERLKDLLPAVDLAAFERRPDGSFAPIAPLPAWFARLPGDATFPFLGHILEEAVRFWAARTPGRREWGPCTEVDPGGHPFHYRVTAANVADTAYLLFALDSGSDEMQRVLQRVRQQQLLSEQARAAVRRAADDLRALANALPAAASEDARRDLTTRLASACDELIRRVDAMVDAPPTT